MTEPQERHLDSLVEAFTEAVITKYQAGALEHGGNIWDMSENQLLDEAINETIDQFTYLMTLKQKMGTPRSGLFTLPPVEDQHVDV